MQRATGSHPLQGLIICCVGFMSTFLKKQELRKEVGSVCQNDWCRDEINRESVFELNGEKQILVQHWGGTVRLPSEPAWESEPVPGHRARPRPSGSREKGEMDSE